MTASSSWDHHDHETRASTPQSTHIIDEERISHNQRLQVIRQSQAAFLAPTPPLPLLARDSEADFNEHLNAMYSKDVNTQTLSQKLLTRHPTQYLAPAPRQLMSPSGEASYLSQSLHLPLASPPVITVTSLSPISNPREAITTAAKDSRDTIPAPFNSIAKSTATHSSINTPTIPSNPISGTVRSEAARNRTKHVPTQRKRNRHRRSFIKWVGKKFRKQGPWTPACFHDKTAGENAIKRAENQGF